MAVKSFWKKAIALSKKWLVFVLVTLLTAFLSAGISLAFPNLTQYCSVKRFLPLEGRSIRTKNLGFEYINCRPNADASGTHSRTPLPLTKQYWNLTSVKLSQSPIPNPQSPVTNPQQLLEQGKEFLQAGQFLQAADVWQKAVTAFQDSGNKQGEALALSYLSFAYQQLGKWKEAESAIASSLSLIRNLNQNKNSQLILAQALNNQGHLQFALGKLTEAIKTWEETAAIYSRIGDTEGTIGSQINIAQGLQSLGLYRRAQTTLEQIEISLNTQPNSLIKATALLSLGNALQAIGELDKSRQVMQKSLSIAQELQIKPTIGAAFFSLGNTARAFAKKAEELKDSSMATTEFRTAIEAYQKSIELSTSPFSRVQAQINQLSLLVDMGKVSEAQDLLTQININQLPASRKSVYARIYLAETLVKLNQEQNIQESVLLLTKAIQEAIDLQDSHAESFALGNLGRLYELTGQFKDSTNLTQQALSLAQAVNASDITYRWQWQLGRLLKKQGDRQNAIASYNVAVETLKSLRNDLVAINPGNPDLQFSFRQSVEPVYRELVDLLLPTQTEPSQENLRQARSVIESLQLAELDNFFQEACLDTKPVQIDRLDKNAAIIYTIVLPDRLAIILALPQSPLRLYTTLQNQTEVESTLKRLRISMETPINNRLVLQLYQQVYNWMIQPIEAEIKQKNIQTLVFISDGLLRNISLAALYDGEKYLIEKYSIALTPGLQLLPPQPLKKEQFRVLLAGISEANQNFPALPSVEQELKEIRSLLPAQELLNQEFTDNNLQKILTSATFPIIHFATHGQFSSQADETFILAWNSQINVKNLDQLLRVREQQTTPPIELLVFSACETAAGDNRAALGLAGVAVRAGARSTLATLWRVSDESTAALMVKFYQELAKEGATKAEALRLAQLSILKDEKYQLPFFWAPYVLVGNWQ
ncbi:CHAT domain-containing protein [Phormidium sp. LEGE 05292]|uniref:CHAT domain-containing protein n=1 Tax=[Phormidium] sp. LEGE 05292 TaxID=767427 RepID=UPI001880F6B5|nr:CHAT domain-containing protein [Phormidium sp. LEGE 05292]MBE9224371.1 CHAT domain-containing protein [Phormidium sp. LEGE 05292]